jgi:hypothetical protein
VAEMAVLLYWIDMSEIIQNIILAEKMNGT